MITKHDVEKVIVPRPGVATPSAGNRLYDLTTGALNLAVGGFGVYVDVPGSSNPVAIDGSTNIAVLGTTSGVGRPFRIIMRRDTSNDSTVLHTRYFEQTKYITNECLTGIKYGAEPFSVPQSNSYLVNNLTGFTINTDLRYALRASAHGYRTDMMHSFYNAPTTTGYAEGSATDAVSGAENKMDYLMKSLVRDFNRKNSIGFIQNGFAIALDAGDGVATTTGPVVNNITEGSTIIIGYDKNCQAVSLLVTPERNQAFAALEAYAVATLGLLAGDLRIAPYAFQEDGCTASVELAGGGTSAAKMIFVVAIDESQAHHDEVPNTKKSLNVSLSANEIAVATNVVMITAPNEGSGQGRNLKIAYNNTEDYRAYTSSKAWGANHVAFPNEVLEGEGYDIFTISHCLNRMATSGLPSVSPHWSAIALVNTDRDGGTPWSLDAVNAQKTYLAAVLNAYATAWGVPTITI